MPKVSAEHLEERRSLILRAASRCFARQGFYQTSMADIVRESGLSNGGVFMYFKTRDELLSTVILRTVDTMAHFFTERTRACTTPAEAVLVCIHTIAQLMQDTENSDFIRLFPQIYSELQNNHALRAETAELFGPIITHFESIARSAQEHGQLSAELPALGVANMMLALFQGYIIQRMFFGSYFDETAYLACIPAAFATPR